MKKKRILVVSHGHPDFSLGGAEVAAYNLFKAYSEHELVENAWFLARADKGKGATGAISIHRENEYLWEQSVNDYFYMKPANPEAVAVKFFDLIQAIKPDIVHVHHYVHFGLDIFRLIKYCNPEIKIIFTIHEYIAICANNGQMIKKTKNMQLSGGRPFIEKLKKAAAGASAIIAWGNCASWGCVQAARPNPTQATPIDKVITDKPIVKVPGCPPIPDVMSAIITYMVTFDRLPELDRMGRPLMFYGQRIHDKCYRRAHFDAGEFVESWDDAAARKGYCLYKMGCKGPTTYNACSSTRWNDGVSFPIQSGHGCLGCSENGFWDRGSFYSRVVDIPQMGTHSTADTVGLTALGVVAAGVGGHAVASALNQRKRHKQQLAQAEQQPDNEDKQA